MSADSKYCMVLTTTETPAQARDLAEKVVREKLAACVQTQQVRSCYTWKGEMHEGAECLLLIKTRTAQYQQLEEFIKKNHLYETPEIVQVPIVAGSKAYLNWIDVVTGG